MNIVDLEPHVPVIVTNYVTSKDEPTLQNANIAVMLYDT